MEREKSQKKPTLGKVGYQLETTALISKWNYNTLRIRCIMLILEKFKNLYVMVCSIFLISCLLDQSEIANNISQEIEP